MTPRPDEGNLCGADHFNLCSPSVSGLNTYDAEGRAACKTLDGVLKEDHSKGYVCPSWDASGWKLSFLLTGYSDS